MSPLRTSVELALFFTLGLSQIVISTDIAIAQNINLSRSAPNSIQLAQTNTIIFVAPNGSDTNLGISADQPLRSITAALKKIPRAAQPFN